MKNLSIIAVSTALLTSSILLFIYWPAIFAGSVNKLLSAYILLLTLCCFKIAYLFVRRTKTSDDTYFIFGCMLVFSSIILTYSAEDLVEAMKILQPFTLNHERNILNVTVQIVSITKNIVSFGICAIGAGIVSNVISRR